MDSLVLDYQPIINQWRQLFAFHQDSIRFEAFKEFAIYYFPVNDSEPVYKGHYRVVRKSVFKLGSISNMMANMFFGVPANDAVKEVLSKRWKGRVSKDSKFCLVAFEFVQFLPDFEKRNFNNPIAKF